MTDRDSTSSRGDAARITLLEDELGRLVRTKRSDVEPTDFPGLLGSERVQQCAKERGLHLNSRADFLETLRLILVARAKEEERAATNERFPPGTLDDWRKFRVATPAIALLGLSRLTASRGREARRNEAAETRGRARAVMGRTIKNKNHEPVIMEEAALLFASDQPLADYQATVTLEAIRNNPSLLSFGDLTRSLSKDEFRRLAVEFVDSYDVFHAELEMLARTGQLIPAFAGELEQIANALGIDVPPRLVEIRSEGPELPAWEFTDEDSFPSLHAFANRRLDNEVLMHFAYDLESVEQDTPQSRFAWLARVLQVLHFHLIAFGPRGWALLAHSAERAAGNYHVFLETMESTQFGRRTLQTWAEDFMPQSYNPIELSSTHSVWLTGLKVAKTLLTPNELGDQFPTMVGDWVLCFAHDDDAKRWEPLIRGDQKDDQLKFTDDASDGAFLRLCRT